jgi:hypothetical protein
MVEVKVPWLTLYRAVCEAFDHVKSTPRQALLATDAELHEEAMWYAELRGRRRTSDWMHLLLPREVASLTEYSRLHYVRTNVPHTTDDVWNLGDNASSRVNWSEVSGRIPTYRLHNQLFWYPAMRRPMTVMEKVATLAWPVYASMMIDPAMVRIMPSREEARHMLGNAWHLANGTIALLTALASVRLPL